MKRTLLLASVAMLTLAYTAAVQAQEPVATPADLTTAVEAAKKAGRPTVLLGFANRRGQTGVVPVKVN